VTLFFWGNGHGVGREYGSQTGLGLPGQNGQGPFHIPLAHGQAPAQDAVELHQNAFGMGHGLPGGGPQGGGTAPGVDLRPAFIGDKRDVFVVRPEKITGQPRVVEIQPALEAATLAHVSPWRE